jgi:hypothetical protein
MAFVEDTKKLFWFVSQASFKGCPLFSALCSKRLNSAELDTTDTGHCRRSCSNHGNNQ